MDKHFIVTSRWRIDGDVKLNSALWLMTENMLVLFSQLQAKNTPVLGPDSLTLRSPFSPFSPNPYPVRGNFSYTAL
ncbi:hypothetical protein ED795_03270 [Escherichia coli]|nr:hypothetical protein [Escherichia coli]